jgi:hypothetical protein
VVSQAGNAPARRQALRGSYFHGRSAVPALRTLSVEMAGEAAPTGHL